MHGVSPGLIFIPMEKIAADLRSYSSPSGQFTPDFTVSAPDAQAIV